MPPNRPVDVRLSPTPGACLLSVLVLLALPAWSAPPLKLEGRGSVQVAFTPGDDAAGLVLEAIASARMQILVQAYSFTHQAIADALIAARRRGLDVRVIADLEQRGKLATSRVDYLADNGVPVWLDGEHAAAHDKVMIIDAGQPEAAVITGSFNFTHAAQYRNAENLLILRGNPPLVETYAANWRRHRIHSLPLRPRP